jgi:hypothetical protein
MSGAGGDAGTSGQLSTLGAACADLPDRPGNAVMAVENANNIVLVFVMYKRRCHAKTDLGLDVNVYVGLALSLPKHLITCSHRIITVLCIGDIVCILYTVHNAMFQSPIFFVVLL